MLNLIRMNLYSLVRTMSFWIMVAVTIMLSVIIVVTTNAGIEDMTDQPAAEQMAEASEQAAEEDDIVVGVTVNYDYDEAMAKNKIPAIDFLEAMLSGGVIALLAAIFIAIYTNAEQKTGFIKNIAGQLPKRGLLSLAKLAGIAVELLIMFAVFILATLISAKIVLGDKFVFGSAGDIIKLVAVQYLLNLAFCSLVQMFCTIARGAGIGMTVGIFFCSGVPMYIYNGINYVVHKLGAEDFDISKYDLIRYIGTATTTADNETIIKCVIAGAAYLVVCTAVSIIVMQKRDIK